MTIELGHAASFLALGMSVLAAGAGLSGRDGWAVRASAGCFGLLAFAFVVLLWAFAVSDFSVVLVAGHSSLLKPFVYKLAASWGNHEGSMLLWCLVSSGWAAVGAVCLRGGVFRARVLGVQGVLTALFLLYLLLASSPFDRLESVPFAGRGLNPLLQHPALVFHPPFLYLGYVGFSFVFSLAVAWLTLGTEVISGIRWACLVRPWAIVSSGLLGVGIFLGSLWAYYELGWGGWWFWDPVENASLIPWLTGMVLVHCLTVTERSGKFLGWSVLLSLVCFSAALFGAFLVRSGVLTSVHAFANAPERGALLIFGAVVISGGAFGLYARAIPVLAGSVRWSSGSRRHLAIGLNNLFLCTAAATVLVGTVYPLAVEVVTGEKVSVGPPYFELTVVPLTGLALVFAPVVQSVRIGWLWVAGLLALLASIVVLCWAGSRVWAVVGTGLGVWLICGTLASAVSRFRLRGLRGCVIGSGSVLGVTLAHIGLGVLVIGAVSESAGRVERTVVLAPGERTSFAGWEVILEGVDTVQGVNFEADIADIEAIREDRSVRFFPEKRRYFPSGIPTTETAIDRVSGGHFHIALGEPVRARPGSWTLRLSFNPLVDLVFLGMFLVACGVLSSLLRRVRVPGEVGV